VFCDPDFAEVAGDFLKFKADIRLLNKHLVVKYGAKDAPLVVFFDCTGKKLYSFSNYRQSVKPLVKKMKRFLEESREALEKAKAREG